MSKFWEILCFSVCYTILFFSAVCGDFFTEKELLWPRYPKHLPYQVIYKWKTLDFQFHPDPIQSRSIREDSLRRREFIPENNVITSAKVKGNRMFVTVPRWKPGVPATLNTLYYPDLVPVPGQGTTVAGTPAFDASIAFVKLNKSPPLTPYPNIEMNQVNNCAALQYVQAIEIDEYGRLWIVDAGSSRVNLNETTHGFNPGNYGGWGHEDNGKGISHNNNFGGYYYDTTSVGSAKCPPKLMVIDLDMDETIRFYVFPENVVRGGRFQSFLNDIVVGCSGFDRDDCWAYISDTNIFHSRIVVYSFKMDRAWSVRHPSMRMDWNAQTVNVQGTNYVLNMNGGGMGLGLALSPKDTNFSRLFYEPLGSCDLFSVSTIDLQNAGGKISNLPTPVVPNPIPNRNKSSTTPRPTLNPNSVTNGDGLGLSYIKVGDSEFELTDAAVSYRGRKKSASDGMTMDNTGHLYFGMLDKSAVGVFKTSTTYGHTNLVRNNNLEPKNQQVLVQNARDFQWTDDITIDDRCYAVVTANKLQSYYVHPNSNTNYPNIKLDPFQINFRIIRFFTGRRSYMYSNQTENYFNNYNEDSGYQLII